MINKNSTWNVVYSVFQYEGLKYQIILLSFGCFFFVSCLWNAEEKDILSSKSSCLSPQQDTSALGDSWGLQSHLSLSNRRIYCLQNHNVDFGHCREVASGDVGSRVQQPAHAGRAFRGWWMGGGTGRGTGRGTPWGTPGAAPGDCPCKQLFGIPIVSKRFSRPGDGHPLRWEGAASQGLTTGGLGTAE